MIATKGSLDKQSRQVSKVFQLLLDTHRFIEIDRCVFDVSETVFLVFVVSSSGLRMDAEKTKEIVDWPRTTTRQEVQQVLGLWNRYGRFIHNFSAIVSPFTDLLRQDI